MVDFGFSANASAKKMFGSAPSRTEVLNLELSVSKRAHAQFFEYTRY